MPQLVKKRRSGWAVLAVGALIASILAVVAGPVSGQQPISRDASPNNNPDWGASWSSCVGAAGSHDAMFSDVDEDNVHADAIDCIAYYGVTVGKGDGTYAPSENVSAFQMRLFVQRAADRMGADGEAVISGVTLSDPVTRLQMAQLMFGLVNDIDGGVRYHPSNNDIEFADADGVWHVVDDFFADARAQVPTAESQLVGAAYELGITRGTRMDGTRISTPDSVFEPFEPVSRAQMAAFIARTMDHSNLRPAGLAMQRNLRGDTLISLRDADFAPIENEPIDVFSALYADDAFDADDGECELLFVKDETPSHDVCLIDIGDQLTDDEGNVEFELSSDRDPITVTCGTGDYTFSSATGSESTTFWAWTGSLGDELDEDTVRATLESVGRPVGTAGPDYARISGGLPTGDELAKMGETVTFNVQLHSDTSGRDGNTLDDDEAVGPDRTGNVYLLQIERHVVIRALSAGAGTPADPTDDVVTDSDYGDEAGGETKTGNASVTVAGVAPLFPDAPGDWNLGPKVGAAYYTPVFPNADGEFSIVLDNPDYHAATNNPDVGVRFTLRPFGPSNDLLDANPLPDIVIESGTHSVSEAAAGVGTRAGVSGGVIFSDDPSDPHSAAAESESYRIISGSRTPNTVTVKVVDQYGDPQRNVDVSVNSDLDDVDVAADSEGETGTANLVDEVLYPEQVDITVQQGENGNGVAPANELTLVDPTDVRTSLTSAAMASVTATAVAATDPADSTSTATESRIVTVPVRVDANGAVITVPTDDVMGTFKTRSNGTYRIGYAYIAATEAQTETITPQSTRVVRLRVRAVTASDGNDAAGSVTVTSTIVLVNADGLADGETDANGNAVTVTAVDYVVTDAEVGSGVEVYWTQFGTSSQSDGNDPADLGGDPEAVPVYVSDVGRRTIVANEQRLNGTDDMDNPMAYFYDEDDVFIIANAGSIGASFEMFEEALALTVKDDGCKVTMVSWDNYTFYRDPARYGARPGRVDRTIWEITVGVPSS